MSLPAKRLLLFPQDKGGIGKSFIATLLYDQLVEAGVAVQAFDLNHANATFQRFVPEAGFIDPAGATAKPGVLDRILQGLADADVGLVDNPASGSKLLTDLDEMRWPETPAAIGCELVFVVIATDDKDANSQIAELLDSHGPHVRWLVARNRREGSDLSQFDQSKARQRLAGFGAVEIDVPGLAEVTRDRLQKANLTVGRGRTAAVLHLLDRSRCVRFHEHMAAEFGRAQALLVP